MFSKQPLAVDINLISKLVENYYSDFETQCQLYKLIDNLKKFHEVVYDNKGNFSDWLEAYKELRNKYQDTPLKIIFDAFNPRLLSLRPIQVDSKASDYLEDLTRKTPEKIGVKENEVLKSSLGFYGINYFNDPPTDAKNFLLRIPKVIDLKSGDEIDFRIFSPYLRNATKVEFCDRYFFKNPQYDDDANFILNLIRLSKELNEINFHLDTIEYNKLHLYVKTEIEKNHKRAKINFIKFNTDKNHDRFIIIDNDKISIKLTTSFSNFRLNDKKKFIVKDNCSLIFNNGRSYSD